MPTTYNNKLDFPNYSYYNVERNNLYEKLENTKEIISIRKSKKGKHYNDQKKKYKRTNNDL